MYLQWERFRNTICQSINVVTKQTTEWNKMMLNQQTNIAKIQSMIYMITGITIVEDFFKKGNIFPNNSNVFIKGFCFQRCYWDPHIPWQTSASQNRHQRYFPSATASVTCPLEKQNKKCFNIHCDTGNQSILWPRMNKHCVINAFIQKMRNVLLYLIYWAHQTIKLIKPNVFPREACAPQCLLFL